MRLRCERSWGCRASELVWRRLGRAAVDAASNAAVASSERRSSRKGAACIGAGCSGGTDRR